MVPPFDCRLIFLLFTASDEILPLIKLSRPGCLGDAWFSRPAPSAPAPPPALCAAIPRYISCPPTSGHRRQMSGRARRGPRP